MILYWAYKFKLKCMDIVYNNIYNCIHIRTNGLVADVMKINKKEK